MLRKGALIVDDSNGWLDVLEELLKSHGYTCIRGKNYDMSRELIDSEEFELAILDVNLSAGPKNIDGLRLCQYIRDRLPEVKVILISAEDQNLSAFPECEAIVFLNKAELWNSLNHYLEG